MKTILSLLILVVSAPSLFAQPFDIKTIPTQCIRNIQSSNELLYGIANEKVVVSKDSGKIWTITKWQPDLEDITTEDGLKSHERIGSLWVDDTIIYCGISGMNFNHIGQPWGGGGIARSNGKRICWLNILSVFARDSFIIAYQQYHLGTTSYSTNSGNSWTQTNSFFYKSPAGVIGKYCFSQGPYVSIDNFITSKPLPFIDSLNGGYNQLAVSPLGILAAIHKQKNITNGPYELYYSLDTGKTWVRHPNDVQETVRSIHFIGRTLLLANNEPCNIVDVEENHSEQIKLSVYPNPASNTLVINSPTPLHLINILSVYGQSHNVPFHQTSDSSYTADISALEQGTYTVLLKENNQVQSVRFVVIR